MLSANSAPHEPWEHIGNEFAAGPTKSRSRECETLQRQLYSISNSLWHDSEHCVLWPAHVRPNNDWKYYVVTHRDGFILKARMFLRRRGAVVERYGVGPTGSNWYALA